MHGALSTRQGIARATVGIVRAKCLNISECHHGGAKPSQLEFRSPPDFSLTPSAEMGEGSSILEHITTFPPVGIDVFLSYCFLISTWFACWETTPQKTVG